MNSCGPQIFERFRAAQAGRNHDSTIRKYPLSLRKRRICVAASASIPLCRLVFLPLAMPILWLSWWFSHKPALTLFAIQTPRHWCEICKIFIERRKGVRAVLFLRQISQIVQMVAAHENGPRHKANQDKQIRRLKMKKQEVKQQQEDVQSQLAEIEWVRRLACRIR